MVHAVNSSFSSSFITSKRGTVDEDFSYKEVPLGLAAQRMSSISSVKADTEIEELIKSRVPGSLSTKRQFSTDKVLDCIFIELTESLYAIGELLLNSADFEIDLLCENLQKHMKNSSNIIKESIEKSQEFGIWQLLEKIGTSLLAACNFIFGGAAIASGSPIIGSTLIAAAVLSTANLAMTEMQGWDYIAKRVAKDNKKLEEELRLYLPLASTLLASSLTATGSYLTISQNLLQNLGASAKVGESVQKALLFYTTFASAGKTFTEGSQQRIKAGLAAIQDKIEIETFHKDTLSSWLKDFLQSVNGAWESTKTIIETSTQKRISR